MSGSLSDEAFLAFEALERALKNLERDLSDGEGVFVTSALQPAIPLLLNQIVRQGPLLIILAHDSEGQAHKLVMAPGQMAIQFSTGPVGIELEPIGFIDRS